MVREVITDVVCPFCGSLCDDGEIILEDGKIVETRNLCTIGTTKFLSSQNGHRILRPMIRENGELKETTLEKAIKKAAEILVKAERPLLYGWSSTECDTQRVGIELAEEINGVIDDTASVCHGPSTIAKQEVGLPSCTLGQIKNRADVIVYWGCNPAHAHPRHMARYTTFIRGFFREQGKQDRTLIVVDVRNTDTAKLADHFIQVKPGYDYELFAALRAAIKGQPIRGEEVGGVPVSKIKEVAEIMKNAGFGVIFFGLGLTMSRGKHRNVTNAINTTIDLNKYTKFVIMPMRGHYNVSGFGIVGCWQAGYPFGIDFQRGYPYYNPGETTSIEILQREEADAILVIASDPVSHFPARTISYMAKLPVIAIEPHMTPTTEIATVVIPSAIAGIECEGTAYRMDHVPIRLRKVTDPPDGCLPDRQILEALLEEVRKLKSKS
ncbi:MAG: formylmethanofuran dehydrogenase subunit B [Candidatus Freyarchaeota archaeon]